MNIPFEALSKLSTDEVNDCREVISEMQTVVLLLNFHKEQRMTLEDLKERWDAAQYALNEIVGGVL